MPWRINVIWWNLILIFLMTGCPKVTKIAPPSAPPSRALSSPPPFEKTFGEISFLEGTGLLIRYKGITILSDPGTPPPGNPYIDYLLLSDNDRRHFSSTLKQTLRKDIKILGANDVLEELKQSGFTQSKGLSQVQRIMLKKDDAFLFVTVAQSKRNNHQANGYLLEFDNGRNLFISGSITDEPTFRQFVYNLRDDGKQIDIGIFYTGSDAMDEMQCAQFMSLFQPRIGVVLNNGSTGSTPLNANLLQAHLKDEIFSGEIYIPNNGGTLPF